MKAIQRLFVAMLTQDVTPLWGTASASLQMTR
jgi:hypothetical protein